MNWLHFTHTKEDFASAEFLEFYQDGHGATGAKPVEEWQPDWDFDASITKFDDGQFEIRFDGQPDITTGNLDDAKEAIVDVYQYGSL